jgi:hypothetical protein
MPLTDDNADRRCSRCGGAWITRFDFDHAADCWRAAEARRVLALDMEEYGPGVSLVSITRPTRGAELEDAEDVGIYLVEAAPFLAPGQESSTAKLHNVTVEIIAGKRHHVRFDDVEIPSAA